MECTHCNKQFSTKGSLATHQKTAKYCLERQSKQNNDFGCTFCQRTFTLQHVLNDHLTVCKEKHKQEIIIRKDMIILQNKNEFDLKSKYYIDKLTEKDDYILKLDSSNQKYEEKLEKQKIEYETKLAQQKSEYAIKLEKFENAIIASVTQSNRNKEDDSEEDEEYEDNIPIPLGEKMSSIVIEDVKEDIVYSNIILNNVVITSRPLDHYVNATQLCQAGGKKFSHWFSLETTKELINELSSDAGITASLLVDTIRGRSSKFTQGSWIHPDLSIQLAQWISPKFAIQVSKWIRTLFNQGSLQIDMNLLHEKDREMRLKDHRIKQLEAVCLSKQRRVEYPERNVIYMLTTDDHRQRRTYIIGKAKNLTNRLSTYNKTCDHTVIHYRECKNEDDMDAAETMVLTKLRSHREQANRDRFILPEDKDESLFIQTIDECVLFLA